MERERYNDKWHLEPHAKLVKGSSRGAIYDLNKERVYSINQAAVDIIEGKKGDENFWNTLESLGLASQEKIASQEDEIPDANLSFVWLEITEKCNLRCIHCYGKFGQPKVPTSERMTFNQWKSVISQLKQNKVRSVTVIGGEPDIYRDRDRKINSYNILQAIRNEGIENIEYFTNATLLNPEKARFLKSLGVSVALSLYSIKPDTHDSITQVRGSFQKTMRSINILLQHNINLRVAVILMKQNENDILPTLEWLKEHGLLSRNPDIVRLNTEEDMNRLLPSLSTQLEFGLITEPNFSISRKSFFRNNHWHTCLAGKICICCDGKVLPCVFDRENVLGNVKHQTISEIVKSEETQRIWKTTKDQVMVCQDCEYRYACGDCRPISVITGYPYTAPYSRCTYNPYTGEWNTGKWKLGKDDKPVYDRFNTKT